MCVHDVNHLDDHGLVGENDHVYGEHTYSMRNEKLNSQLLISHRVPISRNEKLYIWDIIIATSYIKCAK